MSSAEVITCVPAGDRPALFDVARRSIRHGLEHGRALAVEFASYPAVLQQSRACFVTLKTRGALRGCMGCLTAHRALVQEVAYYSYQAAFCDPRFHALEHTEYAELSISLSVLSAAEPIHCDSEVGLIEQLRPGIDGVILRCDSRSATLLPQVWQQAPDPYTFLSHLKRKAGLAEDYWSPEMRFERYRAESFVE
jgi:AmmeMemoRadiSam system protein A